MRLALLFFIALIFSNCKVENNSTDSAKGISPQKGNVIITELMPHASDEEIDWIEFYNRSEITIDLRGCTLTDDSGEELKIDQTLIINPNEYIVITGGSDNDVTLPESLQKPLFKFSKEQFSLSTRPDQVTLNCNGSIIDRVMYDSYQPGLATNSRSFQIDPNYIEDHTIGDMSKWCYTILSDDYIYGDNHVGSPGQENLFCTELEFPYAYVNNQKAALIEGIDFEATLKIAEEEFARKSVTSELTIWAIRDQQITPDIAKTIAKLYVDNIEMLYDTEAFTILDWNHAVWHFGWAISNLYRNGDDAVKRELQEVYEDAKSRPQTLDRYSLIALDNIIGPNILMGDIHDRAHAYAVTHIVVPGNPAYIQNYEEYLDARPSGFKRGMAQLAYNVTSLFD